ncbi:MAG: hypothetical protein IT384_07335 [Deltaproteobacteria bacterium]|nr:hypothetical protein [Deltaproteobacteria bacterium]
MFHAFAVAAQRWLSPQPGGPSATEVLGLAAGLGGYLLVHLFAHPWVDLATARLGLERARTGARPALAILTPLRAALGRAIAIGAAGRVLPGILALAGPAVFAVQLRADAWQAEPLIRHGTTLLLISALTWPLAAAIALACSAASAALADRPELTARTALEASAQAVRGRPLRAATLWLLLAAIDLSLAWIAAFAVPWGGPPIELLGPEALRAWIPALLEAQLWVLISTGVAAMLSRALRETAWALFYLRCQVRGTSATPT